MSAATVAQKPADEPQQLGSIDQSRTAAYLQDSLTPGTFRIGPQAVPVGDPPCVQDPLTSGAATGLA